MDPSPTERPIPDLPAPEALAPGSSAPGPAVRPGRALRFATREAWDSLGLVCLASLTVTLIGFLPFASIVARLGFTRGGPAITGWIVGILFLVAAVSPLFAGACWLANVVMERDEPAYADLWRGARRMFGRAVALGMAQALVWLLLLSNLAFYLSQRSFGFLLLAILFLYLLAFWAAQVTYHFPLLVASERGLLKRDEPGRTSVPTILRNGLVMTLSAPAYSLLLAVFLAAFGAVCAVSGAGMALLFPGYAAFVGMQATRDQLVRFGHIPAPPDPDEPVTDERWRV